MANEEKLLDYLKRVTADLHRTRERLREVESQEQDPIAIVGMGCRYPGGVNSPEDLWRLVADGVDAIGDFPTDRGWDTDALYDADPDTPAAATSSRAASSTTPTSSTPSSSASRPREALAMDPQQRLLLETSLGGVRAGRHRPGLAARQPRPASSSAADGQDYGDRLHRAARAGRGVHAAPAAPARVVSGRVAYTFGLEGPAVTVDTACSSSLVALHLAAQALRQRRVRPGAGRRRHRDVARPARSSSSAGSAAWPPTAAASRSPRPPTAPAGARASACCCWNGSPTPSATATGCSPSSGAPRSTRTARPTG